MGTVWLYTVAKGVITVCWNTNNPLAQMNKKLGPLHTIFVVLYIGAGGSLKLSDIYIVDVLGHVYHTVLLLVGLASLCDVSAKL